MRKNEIMSLSFLLLAGIGAALVYLEYTLAGQITYVIACLGGGFQTKAKAATFQAAIALIIWSGIGYVTGDWWHSAALVFAHFAINLRIYTLFNSVYAGTLFFEPVLAILGLGIYVAANVMHSNSWEGWIFPGLPMLLGLVVALINLPDRMKVKKLLDNGLIEIGSVAPDFSLESHSGEKISLADYRNIREVLLIFVRGDWCPSCHIMLRMYEKERQKFQDKNVMLFAIGPDPVGVNRAMVEKLGVEFAVLSDDNMEVSRSYCLEVQKGIKPFDAGVPLPASFLIDRQGIVRYTSRANNAGEFLNPNLIFEVLAKI